MIVTPFRQQVKRGDKGTDVVAYKRVLRKRGYRAVDLSRTAGSAFAKAVSLEQNAHGLKLDGVVGPKTHAILANDFDHWGVFLYTHAAIRPHVNESYRDPYRSVRSLGFAGVDQGVDFSGEGQVFAIGPARITVSTTRSGWPGGGAVGYTLVSGPRAGRGVYFVENIIPLVKVGQLVDSDVPIARMRNEFPYTESGWAHPGTVDPIAHLHPDPHSPKPEGFDFARFLRSLGTKIPAE